MTFHALCRRIHFPTFLFVLPLFVFLPHQVRAEFLDRDAFVNVTQKLLPSVVTVSTTFTPKDASTPLPLGREKPLSLGTGVVIDDGGTIVTNFHLLDIGKNSPLKLEAITITFSDGKKYSGVLLGSDPDVDIAVLKAELPPLTKTIPAFFGNSTQTPVGTIVVAIGNKLARGINVSQGIISAKGFTGGMRTDDGDSPLPIDYIHTDASIDRGNSGGPLVNLDGEVIGINTAIISSGASTIGIAIPSNTIKDILPNLIAGNSANGWIGAYVATPEEDDYELFDLPRGVVGVIVTKIDPEGPAEVASLHLNDYVTHIGEVPIETPEMFRWVIRNASGETSMTLYRAGKARTLTISVRDNPNGNTIP